MSEWEGRKEAARGDNNRLPEGRRVLKSSLELNHLSIIFTF
jgi:hypothetical protein